MSAGLGAVKKAARAAAAAARNAAHDASKGSAPLVLAARGLPVTPYPGSRVISAFHPYQSEISTLELLARLVDDGWTSALPIVVGKNLPLMFRKWAPGDTFVLSRWDIKIPPDSAAEVEPDVLLVPMLAFDRKGYRLGYGGGFYDRTLAKLRAMKNITAIGVAYAGQEVNAVPHDERDQPLDWIMTEKETFKCG